MYISAPMSFEINAVNFPFGVEVFDLVRTFPWVCRDRKNGTTFRGPKATDRTTFGVSKLKRKLHRLVRVYTHVRIQRGDSGPDPPLNSHTDIGFLSNSGPEPLKNKEATEPAFKAGPSSAR